MILKTELFYLFFLADASFLKLINTSCKFTKLNMSYSCTLLKPAINLCCAARGHALAVWLRLAPCRSYAPTRSSAKLAPPARNKSIQKFNRAYLVSHSKIFLNQEKANGKTLKMQDTKTCLID